MRYIAIEEAVSIPALALRQPVPEMAYSVRPEFGQDWARRLADVDEDRIAEMDRAGIDIQVLSLTVPGMQIGLESSAAAANARFVNDTLADMVSRHPTRFRFFAALPFQDPVAAADELRRAVRDHGACGALINNCASALYLDHPRFEPVWSALDELELPLYLHPGSPPADQWDLLNDWPELYGAMWSWGAETAAHAMRIVLSGVFDRHPNARLLLGHMGEFLPFQRSRFDSRWRTLDTARHLTRRPSDYLGTNVLFTTSGVFSPATIRGAVEEVGAESVLFAVDYPYESSEAAVAGLTATELTDPQRELVSRQRRTTPAHTPVTAADRPAPVPPDQPAPTPGRARPAIGSSKAGDDRHRDKGTEPLGHRLSFVRPEFRRRTQSAMGVPRSG